MLPVGTVQFISILYSSPLRCSSCYNAFPMGQNNPPKLPISMWGPKPPPNMFLGPPEYISKMAFRSHKPSLCSWPYLLPILYNGERHVPQKLPLPLGDRVHNLIYISMGPPSPQPKRHLDKFSRFRTDHRWDQQTDHATLIATGCILYCV